MPPSKAASAALTLATAALVLTACSGQSSDADVNSPVKIGITVSNATEPFVVPWLVGQDQGFFKGRGVEISQIVPGKGGSTTVRNMRSGDLPIADVGLTAVADSAKTGSAVTVVGGATQSVYGIDFYALAKNTSIRTINDIKTWGYSSPQSITQALTYLLPEVAGVHTRVNRKETGGIGEGIALLEAGDVDATVVPPSVITKNAAPYRKIVSSADYLKAFQQSVIATTPDYAKSHPNVVKAVVAGYNEAVGWIARNPEQAGKLYADYTDIDPDAATKIVNEAAAAGNWGAGFNAAAIETAVKAMKASGFTGNEADVCAVFDDSFLPAGVSSTLPAFCGGA
ncbi:ABC transporter substrate-binding protein [Microbispora sp. NPDC046933]|uniref:ABC transporter substrate-binding protein n=1 Tax=Microbispora sp. NPDC046933 TaxID=3155618 RepID=UPI0033CA2F04